MTTRRPWGKRPSKAGSDPSAGSAESALDDRNLQREPAPEIFPRPADLKSGGTVDAAGCRSPGTMMDTKDELFRLVQSQAFDPVLHATVTGRSESDRRKLKHVQWATRAELERYRAYG